MFAEFEKTDDESNEHVCALGGKGLLEGTCDLEKRSLGKDRCLGESAKEKKVSWKGPAPWKKSLLREISALEKKVPWMGSVPWRKKVSWKGSVPWRKRVSWKGSVPWRKEVSWKGSAPGRKNGLLEGISALEKNGLLEGISALEKKGLLEGIRALEKRGLLEGIGAWEKNGLLEGISALEKNGLLEGISDLDEKRLLDGTGDLDEKCPEKGMGVFKENCAWGETGCLGCDDKDSDLNPLIGIVGWRNEKCLESQWVSEHLGVSRVLEEFLKLVPTDEVEGLVYGSVVRDLNCRREALEKGLDELGRVARVDALRLCAVGLDNEGDREPDPESKEVLQTVTMALSYVRKDLNSWIPAMKAEYESLTRETEAVLPVDVRTLDPQQVEFVPGKLVCVVKAGAKGGKKKCRGVICGNMMESDPSPIGVYASGADGTLIRAVLRHASLMK